MTELSEQEIRTRYITPAIQQAGWQPKQIREEVHFTDGRIIVRGKCPCAGSASASTTCSTIRPTCPSPLSRPRRITSPWAPACSRRSTTATSSMSPLSTAPTAKALSSTTAPCTDGVVERELALDTFPSPDDLWERYRRWKALDAPAEEAVRAGILLRSAIGKTPRYYQQHRHQPHGRGHRQGAKPHPAGHGHRHRQDLHRLSDHLAAVEGRQVKAHPLSGRPQHPGRPDHDQRLQATSAAR